MQQKTISVDLRVGQAMKIGNATVTLEDKSGRRARLRIVASPGTDVQPPPRASGADAAELGAMLLE